MNTVTLPPAVLTLLRCEVRASKRLAPMLARIVQTCANDLGQPVDTSIEQAGNATVPLVTLILPAEVVVEPHQAWCLACRVACFCPDARVSVLVTGATVPAAASPAATTTAA